MTVHQTVHEVRPTTSERVVVHEQRGDMSSGTVERVAAGRPASPAALGRVRQLVDPALRAAVDALADERMRLVAGYQLGFWDADGTPTEASGKAVRPALAVLGAEAMGGASEDGIPGAVAVELVHNFSLLHDDIMDRDVTRRHRPTGWVVFGENSAILAGNAMLTAAVQVLAESGKNSDGTVPLLLAAVQRLIAGQSADLALEQREDAELVDVLDMEDGKTAALLSCSLAIGAVAAGGSDERVAHFVEAGRMLGLAFQLVDDVLGIVGDPGVTGKSASSDVRAGKRSAPVVAALRSGTGASAQLAELLGAGTPQSDDEVAHAVRLIEDAGGISWAQHRAGLLLDGALEQLELAKPEAAPLAELQEIARFLVARDW
jgi:geranylgeranyl diphosphate synthase type I